MTTPASWRARAVPGSRGGATASSCLPACSGWSPSRSARRRRRSRSTPTTSAAATGLAGVLTNPSVIAMYGPLASQTADALAVFKTVMMGAFLTAVLGFVVVRPAHPDRGGGGPARARGLGRRRALVTARSRRGPGPGRRRGGERVLGRRPGGSRHGPRGGACAFGVAWLAAGLATVGVTAVAVQLASTARGAAGLGFGFLAAMYALRAVADSAEPGTWVHAPGVALPLGVGWSGRGLRGEPSVGVLFLGLAALVIGVSVGVVRAQTGATSEPVLIPARSGPSRGGRLLSSPLGPRHPPCARHGHRLDGRHHARGPSRSGRCSVRSPTWPTTR
jgi:ABC-2 type transport system permease protein